MDDGMGSEQVKKPDYSALGQLGLSKVAVATYEALYLDDFQTAGEIARSINKSRTSVYYVLEQLEQKGFVRREKDEIMHEVTRFWSVRLDKALENLAIYQRRAVKELIDYQIERSITRQTIINARIIDRDWR